MTKMGWTSLCAILLLAGAPGAQSTPAAPTPAAEAAPRAAKAEIPRRGGWLEVKYDVPLVGGLWYMGAAAGPRILGGYRFGRVTLGLQAGFSYSAQDDLSGGSTVGSTRWTNVVAQPVLQVALLQRRSFEVYLQAGAGVSYSVARSGGGSYRSEALGGLAHAAGGARVFLHRRFAVGLELGVSGAFGRGENRYPGEEPAQYRALATSLYGSLGLAILL